LKERETGENAEADRKELQAIRQEMRAAESQHVKEYGGRPRPVLTREERDYIAQHKDAPTLAPSRELIRKELAQAYVIGETSGQAFERKPERKQEQEKERARERGFDRSR
jgi:ribosomal protein S24E